VQHQEEAIAAMLMNLLKMMEMHFGSHSSKKKQKEEYLAFPHLAKTRFLVPFWFNASCPKNPTSQ
jgi:hypothetical protein